MHQVVAISTTSFDPNDLKKSFDSYYLAFVSMVRAYHWNRGLSNLGIERDFYLLELTYDIMNHAGKPEDFSLEDLGEIGCIPIGGDQHGQEISCHAAIREKKITMVGGTCCPS